MPLMGFHTTVCIGDNPIFTETFTYCTPPQKFRKYYQIIPWYVNIGVIWQNRGSQSRIGKVSRMHLWSIPVGKSDNPASITPCAEAKYPLHDTKSIPIWGLGIKSASHRRNPRVILFEKVSRDNGAHIPETYRFWRHLFSIWFPHNNNTQPQSNYKVGN